MQLYLRKYPWDLIIIVGLSFCLLLYSLIFEFSWIRVFLGLPFILFFPGYALLSALFPRREKPESELDSEDTISTKGINLLERIAISIGLSIAIVPLIGLSINLIFDRTELIGIGQLQMIMSIFIFIIIFSIVGAIRRGKLEEKERFHLEFRIPNIKHFSINEKIIAAILIVLIFLASICIIVLVIYPKEQKASTEFYILGKDQTASNYPSEFTNNSYQNLSYGIVNHEGEETEFLVVLTLIHKNNVSSTTRTGPIIFPNNESNIELVEGNSIGFIFSLPDNNERISEISFKINNTGTYKLQILLYENTSNNNQNLLIEQSKRKLHLWIEVK